MIADLISLQGLWGTLAISCLVFGLAPGAVLRFAVLMFPAGDERRKELIAELYAVPRWERPIWVFEQLEVAGCEGIGERMRRRRKARALAAADRVQEPSDTTTPTLLLDPSAIHSINTTTTLDGNAVEIRPRPLGDKHWELRWTDAQVAVLETELNRVALAQQDELNLRTFEARALGGLKRTCLKKPDDDGSVR